jgi:hypothetical protein
VRYGRGALQTRDLTKLPRWRRVGRRIASRRITFAHLDKGTSASDLSSPLQPAQQVAISDLVVTRRLNLTGFTHTFMNSIVLFSIMSRVAPPVRSTLQAVDGGFIAICIPLYMRELQGHPALTEKLKDMLGAWRSRRQQCWSKRC